MDEDRQWKSKQVSNTLSNTKIIKQNGTGLITCVLPIHCDVSQCLNSCSNYLVPTVIVVLFSIIISWSDCYGRSLLINRRI